MSSLMDFYKAPTTTPVPFAQADVGLQSARAGEDANIAQGRLTANFANRTLPQLASSEAASGRFWSSGAEQRAGQATEDVGNQVSDIQRQLARNLADLSRGGVLAQLGVSV